MEKDRGIRFGIFGTFVRAGKF